MAMGMPHAKSVFCGGRPHSGVHREVKALCSMSHSGAWCVLHSDVQTNQGLLFCALQTRVQTDQRFACPVPRTGSGERSETVGTVPVQTEIKVLRVLCCRGGRSVRDVGDTADSA